MFAAIFLECGVDRAEVSVAIDAALRDERGAYRSRFAGADRIDVEVRPNSDASDNRLAFPDGFLHFRYKVELEFRDAQQEDARAIMGALLEMAWGRGWAAVAVCDFEDDLPHGGGYRHRELPWPTG